MISKRLLVIVAVLLASCGSDTPQTDAALATSTPPASEEIVSEEPVLGEVAVTTTMAPESPTDSASKPTTSTTSTTEVPADQETESAAPELGAPAPASGDIRDVDFMSGFGYPFEFGDQNEVLVVTEGYFIDESQYLTFHVGAVQYGDLDGDGDEEAAVQTGFSTGGTGQFGSLTIWDIDGARVVARDSVGTGDRANGGLAHFDIRSGQIITENFDTDRGACCPNMVRQARLVLTADGLRSVERVEPLRWMVPGFDEGELEFLPGTSAAILEVWPGERSPSTIFEAKAGQWVTIGYRRGPDVEVRLLDENQKVLAQAADSRLRLQLPASGLFTLEFGVATDENGPATTVDVSITSTDLSELPTWTSAMQEVVVDGDVPAILLAASPVFDSADRANAEIAEWMASETDPWIEGLAEFPPLDRHDSEHSDFGGSYELGYSATLVSNDLVSFRWGWYEYVCCRPYPNHGNKAIVIDIAEQRIIPVDEILDLDRLDEIHALWLDHAEEREGLEFYLPEDGSAPGFSSLALTPLGVEFGTNRSGALPGTTTVVPYAALGDLVQSDIVERAQGGITPLRLLNQ